MRKNIWTVCCAVVLECLLFLLLVYIGKQYIMSPILCIVAILAFETIIAICFREETPTKSLKKSGSYFACSLLMNLIVFFVHSKTGREMSYGHALYVITLFVFLFVGNIIGIAAAFVFTYLKQKSINNDVTQSANKIPIPRKRNATINETGYRQTGRSDIQ